MEKILDQTEIYTDEVRFQYEHFWQGDEKYNHLKEQFPQYEGICWFACYTMAIQAMNPGISQEQAMQNLYDFTFNLDQEGMMQALSEMRRSGVDTTTFYTDPSRGFINTNNGGFKPDFMSNHPQDFVNLVNFLLKTQGINCKYDIKQLIFTKENSLNQFIAILRDIVKNGGVPIVPLFIADEETEEVLGGHVVMIGGITKRGFIISDPNLKDPIEITDWQLRSYVEQDGIPGLPGERMGIDSADGVQVLSRTKSKWYERLIRARKSLLAKF